MARTCILRAFGLQMSCLSLVLRLFLFRLRFRLYIFIEAAALRSTVLRYVCTPTAKRSYLTTVCVLFFPFFFSFGDVVFFRVFFVPLPFSLCMESTRPCVFPFRIVFFYLVTKGWIFDISLLCENSITKKQKNQDVRPRISLLIIYCPHPPC